MKTNHEHQHWLRRMFERAMNDSTSNLETPINKSLLDYDDLLEVQYLTELDLSNKQLTLLPNEIGNFTDLTHLYLHNNEFTKLPEEIVKLINLIALTFYNNQDLILTDEQNKWVEQLKSNGCLIHAVLPNIQEKEVFKKPPIEEQLEEKTKNIPTLEEWMDAEKKRFIQSKA